MIAVILVLIGISLIVAAASLVFWPAAIAIAGVSLILVGLYVDFDVFKGGRK